MNQVSITSAYMWALVVMIVFLLLAVFIANMILYKPNNPGTTTRRIWFWVCCVLTAVAAFVINYIIGSSITVPAIKNDYLMHTGIACGVAVVLYILIGFGMSKMFPKSKVGTWF